ncbi:hypothetical protein KIN20_000082 [Parelaphostrongylus tenuis]|uniref:SXP/RAL-2 family protein Ani s 5-like cation-binding domain-containing protein n=1 Tax=Parelaphostrongylus tenuis TaxID=148309 RepID=A0AAD5LRM6_PARTN|nr:hypothetical protein KIN20_000082 [Parelaphostrongylus tenuis]
MLTFLLVSVLSLYISKTEGERCCVGEPMLPHTLLRSVKFSGVKEFYKIFNNKKMSRINVTTAIEQWAAKYNKTNEWQQYLNQKYDAEKRRQEMIVFVLQKLPEFLMKITNVNNDLTFSEKEADKQLKELFKSTNRTLASAACCVYSQISTHMRRPNGNRLNAYDDYYDYSNDYNYNYDYDTDSPSHDTDHELNPEGEKRSR